MAGTSRWLTRCNTALQVPGRGEATDESTKPSRRTTNACIDQLEYHVKQCSKIRELRQALVAAGYLTLAQQTESLGLRRSTAWMILQGNHKHSGLSAATIKRMLTSPQLPPPAKKIILEYVEEKLAGAYGHNQTQLRRFRERLGANGFWAEGLFTKTAHVRDGCIQGGRTVASASMVVVHDMVAESAGTAQRAPHRATRSANSHS